MAIYPLIENARLRAEAALKKLDWAAPLLARVTLGVLFVSTGWGKVHSLDKVTGFFTELGIPAPGFHAVLVSFTELFGGALLLVGLASRFAALPLVVSMAVAIITAKRDEIAGLSDLFGLVEWTYLALLVWVALAGPGRASLDQLLFSKKKAVRETSASSEPGLSAKPA
ncbi:MAG: DoxX family protein [Polyangiaceae bacterium]